jgi:hypothetical protein
MGYAGTAGLNYVMLRLADNTSRQALEALQPDMAGLQAAADMEHVHGVIVTCLGSDAGVPQDGSHAGARRNGLPREGYDFLSRFFAPWVRLYCACCCPAKPGS